MLACLKPMSFVKRGLQVAVATAALGCLGANATPIIVDDSGTARNGKVGGWSSVVARGGVAAISYYCEDDHAGADGDMYALRFAWNQGAGWQWVTVDRNGGSDTSMARGSDGDYRIIYAASPTGIGLATGSAAVWSISSVPVPGNQWPANLSMVLDSDNHPHLTYYNLELGGDRALRYVYFDGAAWTPGGANGGVIGTGLWTPTIGFSNTQLALDAARVPHVAFAEPADAINAYGQMKYATLVGGPNGTWQIESLGVLGEDPSLAIGNDGAPRMVFNGDAGITYAVRSGGTWSFETIVPGQWGSSVTMALSDTDVPFVSFGMTVNEDMYFARRDAGAWTVTKIDGDGTSGPHVILGRYGTSIDVDENGAPHISYSAIDIYGLTHRSDLKYEGVSGPPPCVIVTQSPAPQAPCPGDTAVFSVTATGNGPLTYQWRKDGANCVDGPTGWGSTLVGATEPTLTIGGVAELDVARYDCVVTLADCGSAVSAPAALTLGAPAVITGPPAPASACIGGSASFSVSATGGGAIQYEWRKDGATLSNGPTAHGSIISGANSPTLNIANLAAADQGVYDCFAYTLCGGDVSAPATLTVNTCGEVRGDMNCDGVVNNFDIDPFVLALANPDEYERQYPNCDGGSNGDVNDDGALNNFDIDPFVACLIQGGCP
ncbi:MAG: immunoglobulin domain-containing protein [Phycisphaerae bacterium]